MHDPFTRQMARLALLVLAAGFVLVGCGSSNDDREPAKTAGQTTTEPAARAVPKLQLRQIGAFDAPVDVVAVPDTDLLAVVEKAGRVRLVQGMACTSPQTCPARPVRGGDVVLDIRDEVSTGTEQGLLGIAFHPDWPSDPRLYIDYTDTNGDTHVEAWRLDGPDATAVRERTLLQVPQPYDNHNGGHVLFGPDGLLYIAFGDGGLAGDPEDRAQKVDEILGSIARLDVDGGGERGYAIPPGNVAKGAAPVWAIGLRNPWRFSFDAKTGDLWIGDVGQDAFEELDVVPAARVTATTGAPPNFGWRRREGFAAFDETGTRGPGKLLDPVLDYGRDDGCSITGGIVYRGKLVPDLAGWYVFADFCASDLRLVDATGVAGRTFRRGELAWHSVGGEQQVASFGETAAHELLVVSLEGGIYQVLPA